MQGEGRQFGVSRWAAWPPAGELAEAALDLKFVPPLLRRRLSRLSGMALSVAHDCLADLRGVPTVFASQHGELDRTAGILADMARGEPISPTAFSLSVHNSAVGLLALAHKDRAESTAIAAGKQTLAMGLLEASVQAAETGRALFVFAEASPPALYRDVMRDVHGEVALAVLIEGRGTGFSLAPSTDLPIRETPVAQAAALAACLAGETRGITIGDETGAWRVDRDDKSV